MKKATILIFLCFVFSFNLTVKAESINTNKRHIVFLEKKDKVKTKEEIEREKLVKENHQKVLETKNKLNANSYIIPKTARLHFLVKDINLKHGNFKSPIAKTKTSQQGRPLNDLYKETPSSSRNIDLVLVKKSTHTMDIIKNNKVIKRYHVALGKSPIGNKERKGDNKTPEGSYILDYKKTNTQYHLAVHISYPTQEEITKAKQKGYDPGGMILIHGQPNNIGTSNDELDDGNINFSKFIQPSNWTNGCIALLNNDMREFYDMVEPGTPITIIP